MRARRWRTAGLGACVVATVVVACEPRDVVVFERDGGPGAPGSGGDLGTPESGGYAGMDSGGGGGLATGGMGGAANTGGAPNTGGFAPNGGGPGSGAFPGGGPGGPPPCRRSSDCSRLSTCTKPSCGAQTGICVALPETCPPDYDPYCGCDGITYWNDCFRLQNTTAASTKGACGPNGRFCSSPTDCGLPGALCALLVPPGLRCGQPPGQCWVAPDDCSATDDQHYWQSCVPPLPQPSGPCADTCTALHAQGTIFAPAPQSACP